MSRTTLTVADLLLPGEPLDPAEVIAGHGGLANSVTWVVSLRPFPPAFPRLRGGELALVAVEQMARLDPPTTLVSVIEHLASRDASGVAVRGDVSDDARIAAEAAGLPLVHLHPDAPLPDIEQAIMRECALYQARREMTPTGDGLAWLDVALDGKLAEDPAAQTEARKAGYDVASPTYVAHLVPIDAESALAAEQVEACLKSQAAGIVQPIMRGHKSGVVVIAPSGSEVALDTVARSCGAACGVSTTRPLQEAHKAIIEAELASLGSLYIFGGALVRYADLGADRLLLVLYREEPGELEAFVEATLGPLLRHDARAASPLLPTLRAFLEHGGRLRETSADIYVHRNTLAYRLDRAAEILGTDLKEPRARLAIELALRALPLIT